MAMKRLSARFPGKCGKCGQAFPAGTSIMWGDGKTEHESCTSAGAVTVASVTPTASAIFTKLKDGSWGVKGSGLTKGALVSVSKKDGSKSAEVISAIISDENGTQIAILVQKPRASSASRPRSRGRWAPCGYPGCSPSYCDECDGDGRYGRSY